MKRALEGERAIALGMTVNRMAPPRHLDRGLVGLRARISEENEIGEGRVDEAARKALPFRILVQVRNVPQLRTLVRQGFDEVGMSVADGGHGDPCAEIEIKLAGRRSQP